VPALFFAKIQAAILLPQFGRVEENLRRRRDLANLYHRTLAGIEGLKIPNSRSNAGHARHLYTVWIENGRRDTVLSELKAGGIECVVNYRPIHMMSYFCDRYGFKAGAFPNAERIGEETLSLPFYPTMPDEFVGVVADAIADALRSPKTSI